MMSGACGDFHMSMGELWFSELSEVMRRLCLYSVEFIDFGSICLTCFPDPLPL